MSKTTHRSKRKFNELENFRDFENLNNDNNYQKSKIKIKVKDMFDVYIQDSDISHPRSIKKILEKDGTLKNLYMNITILEIFQEEKKKIIELNNPENTCSDISLEYKARLLSYESI